MGELSPAISRIWACLRAAGGCERCRAENSFCVALFEALHGQRPFAGDDMRSLVGNVRTGRVREPSGRTVPRWLRKIVGRGLSVVVDRRWPSMQALLDEIDRGQVGARRRLAAAALVTVGALAAGAWGWHERQLVVAADRCAALGASIDEVWNDAARDRVRAALLATGLASATTTAERLTPWLDRAAAAWSVARTDLCSDADHLPPQLQARASWCLDQRRTALEALLGELARADAAVVQRAISAAAALEDPAPCLDPAWLAQQPTPPAHDREPLNAVQTDLLRAASLQAAGRRDDGLRLAEASLARAEALAWPPLVASARHRVGSLLAAQSQHFARAEAALEAAYFEAASASATGVMADAAVDLVHVVGQELARPLEGQRWGRLAAVALASLEPRPGLRTASLRNNLGNVRRVAGEYAEARALHEQALAIRESTLDPDHPDVANSLNNLANIHYALADHATSRTLHGRALQIRERAFGREHPDVAISLANLANLDFEADDLQAALARHQQALAIRERSLGPDHLDIANSLHNLASVEHALGRVAEVRPLLARTLAIRERKLGPDHPAIAETLANLAIALETVGTPGEIRALHERALGIYERAFGPEHPSVAISLGDLARSHEASGDLVEARRLNARALAIRERTLGPDHPAVAESLQALATLDLELGAWTDATTHARRALTILEATLGPEAPERAAPLATLAAAARHAAH